MDDDFLRNQDNPRQKLVHLRHDDLPILISYSLLGMVL